MKKHRLNILPEMKEEAYVSLKNDIEKNGFDNKFPIYIYEDEIIDGWNRFKACKELKVTPIYKHFTGSSLEALTFILRTNNRRDLSSSQRACLAADSDEIIETLTKEIEEERRKKISAARQNEMAEKIPPSKKQENEVRTKLAETFGTNSRYVSDAQRFKKEKPEVFEQIKNGTINISEAKKEEKKEERDKKIQEIKANSNNYKQSNIKLLEGDLFNEIKKIEDNSIDVLNTDPPYFVLEDSWDTFKNLDEFLVFTENWLKAVKPKLKKTARVYISFAPDYKFHLYKILEKLNFLDLTFGNEIIWVKRNNNKLFKQLRYRLTYEPIIYLYGNKNKLNFTSDTYGETQTDVWEIATPQSNFTEGKYHSAQKPLELYKRIIKTAASNGETVLDCFAGSGTTGIICKELKINCILIEKDIENIKIIKGRL